MTLTRQILIAMLAALLLGSLSRFLVQYPALPDWLSWLPWLLQDVLSNGLIELGGQIFLASLKLLVVPLVLVSLICGVSQLPEISTRMRTSAGSSAGS